MILYDSRYSGNGWKVRLLLAELGLEYERRVLDLGKGDAKTDEFLALNDWGRIPVLQLSDGTVLRESNAILLRFAAHTSLLPPEHEKQVIEWLFFEQADVLRFLARPRYLLSLAKTATASDTEVQYLQAIGSKALTHIERHLEAADYLVEDFSVADIALFPYIYMADQAGYTMQQYPRIATWLARIRGRTNFVPLIENPA